MNIVVHEDNTGYAPKHRRFTAYDDDTYDGAEDSRNRSTIGYGATESEAILDLIEIMYDECEIGEDEAHELMEDWRVRRGMWHWAKRA
jgi:hypothetical protein